jgi:hypothetical protein
MRAEIVQLQKKEAAKFQCSACGADRGCHCNAPAVEKLLEIQQRKREHDRRTYERKKAKENSTPSAGGNSDNWATKAEALTHWRDSILSHVQEVRHMRETWTEIFDKCEEFEVTQELAEAADRAVAEWTEMAATLRRNSLEEASGAARGGRCGVIGTEFFYDEGTRKCRR